MDRLTEETSGCFRFSLKEHKYEQYETIYYISGKRIYIGWYLTRATDNTHVVVTDKIELGLCWVNDSHLYRTREDALAALAANAE